MADRSTRVERMRLDQPRAERRTLRPRVDPDAFGQWTERIARFLGTGRYLVAQTVIIFLWVLENYIPGIPHFDSYPFAFLTLVLSLQASYSAPLILLAQNRQDDRDRVNLDADRDEARQSKADLEYLAREIAAIRMSLGEVATRDFLRSEITRAVEERDRRADDDPSVVERTSDGSSGKNSSSKNSSAKKRRRDPATN